MAIFKVSFFVCCAGSAPPVAPVAQGRWADHLQAAKPKQRQEGRGRAITEGDHRPPRPRELAKRAVRGEMVEGKGDI